MDRIPEEPGLIQTRRTLEMQALAGQSAPISNQKVDHRFHGWARTSISSSALSVKSVVILPCLYHAAPGILLIQSKFLYVLLRFPPGMSPIGSSSIRFAIVHPTS